MFPDNEIVATREQRFCAVISSRLDLKPHFNKVLVDFILTLCLLFVAVVCQFCVSYSKTEYQFRVQYVVIWHALMH